MNQGGAVEADPGHLQYYQQYYQQQQQVLAGASFAAHDHHSQQPHTISAQQTSASQYVSPQFYGSSFTASSYQMQHALQQQQHQHYASDAAAGQPSLYPLYQEASVPYSWQDSSSTMAPFYSSTASQEGLRHHHQQQQEQHNYYYHYSHQEQQQQDQQQQDRPRDHSSSSMPTTDGLQVNYTVAMASEMPSSIVSSGSLTHPQAHQQIHTNQQQVAAPTTLTRLYAAYPSSTSFPSAPYSASSSLVAGSTTHTAGLVDERDSPRLQHSAYTHTHNGGEGNAISYYNNPNTNNQSKSSVVGSLLGSSSYYHVGGSPVATSAAVVQEVSGPSLGEGEVSGVGGGGRKKKGRGKKSSQSTSNSTSTAVGGVAPPPPPPPPLAPPPPLPSQAEAARMRSSYQVVPSTAAFANVNRPALNKNAHLSPPPPPPTLPPPPQVALPAVAASLPPEPPRGYALVNAMNVATSSSSGHYNTSNGGSSSSTSYRIVETNFNTRDGTADVRGRGGGGGGGGGGLKEREDFYYDDDSTPSPLSSPNTQHFTRALGDEGGGGKNPDGEGGNTNPFYTHYASPSSFIAPTSLSPYNNGVSSASDMPSSHPTIPAWNEPSHQQNTYQCQYQPHQLYSPSYYYQQHQENGENTFVSAAETQAVGVGVVEVYSKAFQGGRGHMGHGYAYTSAYQGTATTTSPTDLLALSNNNADSLQPQPFSSPLSSMSSSPLSPVGGSELTEAAAGQHVSGEGVLATPSESLAYPHTMPTTSAPQESHHSHPHGQEVHHTQRASTDTTNTVLNDGAKAAAPASSPPTSEQLFGSPPQSPSSPPTSESEFPTAARALTVARSPPSDDGSDKANEILTPNSSVRSSPRSTPRSSPQSPASSSSTPKKQTDGSDALAVVVVTTPPGTPEDLSEDDEDNDKKDSKSDSAIAKLLHKGPPPQFSTSHSSLGVGAVIPVLEQQVKTKQQHNILLAIPNESHCGSTNIPSLSTQAHVYLPQTPCARPPPPPPPLPPSCPPPPPLTVPPPPPPPPCVPPTHTSSRINEEDASNLDRRANRREQFITAAPRLSPSADEQEDVRRGPRHLGGGGPIRDELDDYEDYNEEYNDDDDRFYDGYSGDPRGRDRDKERERRDRADREGRERDRGRKSSRRYSPAEEGGEDYDDYFDTLYGSRGREGPSRADRERRERDRDDYREGYSRRNVSPPRGPHSSGYSRYIDDYNDEDLPYEHERYDMVDLGPSSPPMGGYSLRRSGGGPRGEESREKERGRRAEREYDESELIEAAMERRRRRREERQYERERRIAEKLALLAEQDRATWEAYERIQQKRQQRQQQQQQQQSSGGGISPSPSLLACEGCKYVIPSSPQSPPPSPDSPNNCPRCGMPSSPLHGGNRVVGGGERRPMKPMKRIVFDPVNEVEEVRAIGFGSQAKARVALAPRREGEDEQTGQAPRSAAVANSDGKSQQNKPPPQQQKKKEQQQVGPSDNAGTRSEKITNTAVPQPPTMPFVKVVVGGKEVRPLGSPPVVISSKLKVGVAGGIEGESTEQAIAPSSRSQQQQKSEGGKKERGPQPRHQPTPIPDTSLCDSLGNDLMSTRYTNNNDQPSVASRLGKGPAARADTNAPPHSHQQQQRAIAPAVTQPKKMPLVVPFTNSAVAFAAGAVNKSKNKNDSSDNYNNNYNNNNAASATVATTALNPPAIHHDRCENPKPLTTSNSSVHYAGKPTLFNQPTNSVTTATSVDVTASPSSSSLTNSTYRSSRSRSRSPPPPPTPSCDGSESDDDEDDGANASFNLNYVTEGYYQGRHRKRPREDGDGGAENDNDEAERSGSSSSNSARSDDGILIPLVPSSFSCDAGEVANSDYDDDEGEREEEVDGETILRLVQFDERARGASSTFFSPSPSPTASE